jgi:hypothetical protein
MRQIYTFRGNMPQNTIYAIVLSVFSIILLSYSDLMAQEPSKAEISALELIGMTGNFRKVLVPEDKSQWSSLLPKRTDGDDPLVLEVLDTNMKESLAYGWSVDGTKAAKLRKQDFITKCGTPSYESLTALKYGRISLMFGDDSFLLFVSIPKKNASGIQPFFK